MGALAPWAVTTIAVIRASSVSLPIRVARTMMRPLLLSADPMTFIPGVISIGFDSPVMSELSTVL